ncbi:hypothetical protein ACFPMF_16035 [Larkinella bovis]|uniref:Uncharacterized protein n=1 Tax=Larkinella bovis TaxID=683041 RepID=A0ABW0IFD2_9BACT
MHPVQHFKANFSPNEVTDATSDIRMGDVVASTEWHELDSNVRNLCFVWEDGRRAFFNYAYLVSVDLVLNDSMNMMQLYFSGQIVTLKGYQLGLLFDLLLKHIPKNITARNPRYHVDGQMQDGIVTEILVRSE